MVYQDKLQEFTHKIQSSFHSLTEVFYIKDINSNFVDCSQGFEKILNVKRKDLLGRTDYDFAWKNYADEFRENDKHTMSKKHSDTFEPVPTSKKLILASRCVKFPIYDDVGAVIGVIGKADILSVDSNLQNTIQYLRHLDKKHTVSSSIEKSYHIRDYEVNLTPRETECLFLTIRGKSAKEIGKFLKISFRTVEWYIENIKLKMGVNSKSELIDRVIKLKMMEIIPRGVIFTSLLQHSTKWKDFLMTS